MCPPKSHYRATIERMNQKEMCATDNESKEAGISHEESLTLWEKKKEDFVERFTGKMF